MEPRFELSPHNSEEAAMSAELERERDACLALIKSVGEPRVEQPLRDYLEAVVANVHLAEESTEYQEVVMSRVDALESLQREFSQTAAGKTVLRSLRTAIGAILDIETRMRSDRDRQAALPVPDETDIPAEGDRAPQSEQSEENMPEKEPTVQDLALACREVVGEDTYEELSQMEDLSEALGLAFTALLENGIEDPESFLAEQGILEPGARILDKTGYMLTSETTFSAEGVTGAVTRYTGPDGETVELIHCLSKDTVEPGVFQDLIRFVVKEHMSGNDTACVKAERLPDALRQTIVDLLNVETDFPVIAVYDMDKSGYVVVYSEGDEQEGDVIHLP